MALTSPLTLTLTPEQRPDRFTLTCGSLAASIELRAETLSDLLRRLHPVLVGGRDSSGQLRPLALLREVGIRLWQGLFPETLPAAERESLLQGLRTGSTPLLLTLPPSLVGLPWELLCDPQRPDDTGFVARRRPLVRLVPGDTNLSLLAPPLRVLLLISSPPGLEASHQVDVESERAAVESAVQSFREMGLLHLQVEDRVTLRRVQQALLRFKPHLLHYIGHGTYDERQGGFLFWEDDQGQPQALSDSRLAELLRPRGLRAVLLHGCETATSDQRTDFRGVAQALLGAGIPAVLAQQASFTYASSQQASEMFYTALTAGLGLAEASFEARQALAQAERPDWAVPTLQATLGGLAPLLDETAPPGEPDPALKRSGAAADLPAPTGVFVGRQRELRLLRAMLEDVPGSGPVLALISGPGGVGKSTLAAQAVTRYGGRYRAALTLSCLGYQGIDLFLQRIGEFLQRQGAPGLLTETLPDPQRRTAAKIEEAIAALNMAGPFLLVVDNLESVQREDRTLADPHLLLFLQKVLTNLRSGRVLITGRYAVEGLLPAGKFAANLLRVDLDDLSIYETQQLMERHPTLAGLGEVTRDILVREFGGLPYVYDLLSSDAASLSLDTLLRDVQGRVTEERKQRTSAEWEEVRRRVVEFAALEATVARLPEGARRLLARMSVLQRPCPLQALEQGLGASKEEWQALLDWALLRFDPVEGDYRLHSLTAHYAIGLLAETERRMTQVRIAEWYLDYARRESHELSDYLEAYRLWRDGGEVLRAGKLANDLWEPLLRFGLYALWRELCQTTIKDLQEPPGEVAAEAKRQLGMIAQNQGDYPEARRLFGEVLAVFERLGDQQGQAYTLHHLGMIAQDQGDYPEARRLFGESLAIKERLGDQRGRSSTLHHLGMIAQDQGDYAEARRLFGESLAIKERLGDQGGRASTLGQLGVLAQQQGDLHDALDYTVQALEIFERLRSPYWAIAQRRIAELRTQVGETAFAELWQQVRPGFPLPELPKVKEDPRQKLLQQLVEFIQAPNWDESQQRVEANPQFLSEEADALLGELAAAQENERMRELVEQHQALLRRCREVGIAAAFGELPASQEQPADEQPT